MYISDIELNKKISKNTAKIYLCVAAFCLVFSIVYEFFSNGVYSLFMLCSFALPLVGGALPFWIFGRLNLKNCPSVSARYIYHSGIAALTVGFIVKGVLDIYGTSNELIKYYWFVGCSLTAAGIVIFVFHTLFLKDNKKIEGNF